MYDGILKKSSHQLCVLQLLLCGHGEAGAGDAELDDEDAQQDQHVEEQHHLRKQKQSHISLGISSEGKKNNNALFLVRCSYNKKVRLCSSRSSNNNTSARNRKKRA